MPKISLIVVVPPHARGARPAIESALAQGHDTEVVVVDRGLCEDAVALAGASPGPVRYVRQDGAGFAEACNRGLRESSGPYLSFLDAEDFYLPGGIARLASLLDGDPDLAWAYGEIVQTDAAGQPLAPPSPIGRARRDLSGQIFPSLLEGPYFPPHAVLIRRRVLEAVGPFDRALGEDCAYDLWLRVAGSGHRAAFAADPSGAARARAEEGDDDETRRESRRAVLQKVALRHPAELARGLVQFQRSLEDAALVGRAARAQRALDVQRREEEKARAAAETEAVLQYARLTIEWKSKLEAGRVLVAAGQVAAGTKQMIDGVKSVQSSRNSKVILEALLEISSHLAPLDPGRAQYLLNLAADLAGRFQRPAELERARLLLAQLPAAAGR